MKPKHIFVFLFMIIHLLNSVYKTEDCVMFGYGGYSGFWYFYGILQKEYKLDKDLYCYSAGCLAIIASIPHNNYNYIKNTVNNLKINYNDNKINRFDIRNQFISKISENIVGIEYYNINILTSNYFGNCNIIKPKNKKELVNALNYTSSIPFITNNLNLDENIDGFLCLNKYPVCKEKITIPLNLYFFKNILNNNLGDEDIKFIMNY